MKLYKGTGMTKALEILPESSLCVQVVVQLIEAKADMNFRLQTPLLSPLGLLFACMGLRHRWRASTLSLGSFKGFL